MTHRPTIAELRTLARQADKGPHGPDLGKMTHAERNRFLFDHQGGPA